MSQIEKLGIRGIRSFGPDEMRILKFCTPLTLIQGQNGCGKTTIIESLKFITTGEVPPGCGRGVAFVHDPKIAKDTVVRGQVKLMFKSTKGEAITACRSVDVTQKAKRLEFSSIDSVLTYKGPDGKTTSVTNKCLDFYSEMTSYLGVAKPILDHVIFCHQEDSNWPLDEGKKVKDKFDSIFNATKYIKCIDAIRKLRKDKVQAANSMRETLEALKALKGQADFLRRELRNVENNQQEVREEQTNLIEEQGPIRKRLKEISVMESEIGTVSGEISAKKNQLDYIKEAQRDLKAKQTEPIECSDAELFNLILDFERNTRIKGAKKTEVEQKLQRVTREIDALKKDESKGLLQLGKLEAAHKAHLDTTAKGNKLLRELVHKYGITGYDDHSNFDIKDGQEILSRVGIFLDKEKTNLSDKKKGFEKKEAEIQKELDDLRSEETMLEHDIQTLSKQIEENSRKSRLLLQTLSSNEEELSSTSLEDLEKSLEEIERKILEEENRVDEQSVKKEIEEKREESNRVERELEDIKRKVAKMNRLAEARSQYDIHLKNKNSLEQKNQFLKRKNADDFQSIFKGPVGDNVKNELEVRMNSIRRQIKECNEKKTRQERKKTQLATKIENEKQIIAKIEKHIQAYESRLESVCSGTNLDGAIDRTKEQIDHLLKKRGDHESSTYMFRRFMDKVKEGEGCPLCHRDFEPGYDKEMLVDEIQSKLNRLPDDLSQLKKMLLEKESLYEKLIQLRPQKEEADKVAQDLRDQKEKLRSYQEGYEEASGDLEETLQQLSSLVSEEEVGQRVQSDVVTLDSNVRTLRQLNDTISNIQATLGTCDDDLSMDELVKVQSDKEQRAKMLRKEIEASQQTLMEHNQQIQRLNQRKLSLSSKKLELKSKEQETENMKKEIENLRKDKFEKEEKIEDFRIAVAPITFQLREKLDAKKALARERDAALEEESRKIDVIRDEQRAAQEVLKGVRAYVTERREEVLAEAKKSVQLLQEENEAKERMKKTLQEEDNAILKDLNSQKERKRNLEDEKTIRGKEKEATELEQNIYHLEAKMKDFDCDKVSEEKHRLALKDNKIIKARANLEGRLEELKKKKKDFEANLNQKDIKNAEKNYKEKFVEKKCLEVACMDLNKYFKALETAVMKFHQEKMSNINTIIRELWRMTYRGNDIDYIEIKTDETESTGADKKRTYNYRVIMVKSDVEMDMRGRCSAGQKVLASLIIRMALAETFCSSCGILALDEPTTNLDKENIDALSLALLQIVNKRSAQKNLQLIVITHDEDFMERMKRADYIDHYYKVSRDINGLSVIMKKQFQ